MVEEKEFQQRLQRIEGLVHQIGAIAAPDARACAEELVRLLMELHGTGIERMLEIVWESGEAGSQIIDRLAGDALVGGLLLLYGLHPLDLRARVLQALDRLRPDLRAAGGEAELLDINDAVVRVRFAGSLNGCGSSAQAIRSAIEQAVYGAAPDASAVIVDGLESPPVFVPLAALAIKSQTQAATGNSQRQAAGVEAGAACLQEKGE